MEPEIIFYIVVFLILGLAVIIWFIFGFVSMRRIEKAIMAEGLPRPCYWDGAWFRIILYAGALTIPTIMFDERDEQPGKVNPQLVNKYGRAYDRVLAWIFLGSVIGVTLSGIIMMALGMGD